MEVKATGMVRWVDAHSRINIPKELCRKMQINAGDIFEIFTGDNGEIVFKKYIPPTETSGEPSQDS